jgi:hypothetical protein
VAEEGLSKVAWDNLADAKFEQQCPNVAYTIDPHLHGDSR